MSQRLSIEQGTSTSTFIRTRNGGSGAIALPPGPTCLRMQLGGANGHDVSGTPDHHGHDRCLSLQPESLDEAPVAWRSEQPCCDATKGLTSVH